MPPSLALRHVALRFLDRKIFAALNLSQSPVNLVGAAKAHVPSPHMSKDKIIKCKQDHP